jgi:transcriptional regulator with XRE-family HTH domain
MEKLKQHWTARSIPSFVHRITSDFIGQLEMRIEDEHIERQELANRLGVTPGSVSQFLNDPGNATVRKMAEYARALGMKVAIIAYDDNDPNNERGPISAEVFSRCWQRTGKPRDLSSLRPAPMMQRPSAPIHQEFYRPQSFKVPVSAPFASRINLNIQPAWDTTTTIKQEQEYAN